MPRVIPVSNNTSKRYEPYATILYRCGDDTGCCGSTASVCTMKRFEIVMIYVFVSNILIFQINILSELWHISLQSYDFNYRREIEALPMHNHTECHCVNRGSLLRDRVDESMTLRGKRSGQHTHQHHFSNQRAAWNNAQKFLRDNSCRCPRHFEPHKVEEEHRVHQPLTHYTFAWKCRCACAANNPICQRFAGGDEAFPLNDRKYVITFLFLTNYFCVL